MKKCQSLRQKRAFTLVELLISLFIAGIVFASIFALVSQFRQIYERLTAQVQTQGPVRNLVTLLRNDLSKTGFVKFLENKNVFEIKYMIPIEKRNKVTLRGREVDFLYDKRRREITINEKIFKCTLGQYIDDFDSEKTLVSKQARKISLDKSYQLDAHALKEGGRVVIISLLESHETDNGKKQATHLFRTGLF